MPKLNEIAQQIVDILKKIQTISKMSTGVLFSLSIMSNVYFLKMDGIIMSVI